MPVGLSLPDSLLPVPGIRLASAAAGIRYSGRDDLLVIELSEGSRTAAVFTRNAFRAAPVEIASEHLAARSPRYLLINAGNANAGTGQTGKADARASCRALAKVTHCDPQEVLPFSTGVIGERLPLERLIAPLESVVDRLRADGWGDAARAIMTTDTVPKAVSRRIEIGGVGVTITGIAKGAGMIHPDMATMLAFVATDAVMSQDLLGNTLSSLVKGSFNSITVDGDTSTNDACVLVATGKSSVEVTGSTREFPAFHSALEGVMTDLAQAIVRDAEGATRFVSIRVQGARDESEARAAAFTIAHSPLVKTAFFAGDPNWGRILAALGRVGIESFEIDRVGLFLDEVEVVRTGGVAPGYREEDGGRVMSREEFTVTVVLGRGESRAVVWTSDLSHEYVRINAEYRS
ncbi:MAG: bifunctional glutamate N-acetyltransferase/amino-acid acetyltransferase ArgJ [Pseudomonadota bacterium]|nr:bifunctional glutamate N-acetyltransferase/amino-acid acetyltransferase ArgJ [Pseudomonadota bacterium]